MKATLENSNRLNRREAIKRASLFLGAALSASTITASLNAQSKKAVGGTGNLSEAQFGLVESITDRVLPRTDTPGALDVEVPAFIDILFGDYMEPDQKETFRRGLSAVNKASRQANKMPFVELASVEQDEVLKGIAESDKEFFRLARTLIITGYFTSEEVMKNVLNYDFIPGMWKGCLPISETGNVVWAH